MSDAAIVVATTLAYATMLLALGFAVGAGWYVVKLKRRAERLRRREADLDRLREALLSRAAEPRRGAA